MVRTESGCSFSYDSSYLKSDEPDLAFTIPKSSKKYSTYSDNLLPFFAGLLPEGKRLTALIKTLKTSPDDMFSLIATSGDRVIGDVSVKLEKSDEEELRIKNISDTDFLNFLKKSYSANQPRLEILMLLLQEYTT